MEDFIYFLGRFHVLVLHLPIGILTLAIVFEILVRFKPFKFLEPMIAWTWLAGGLSGVATVALGFMHATESGFQDSPAVEAHRWAGVTLTCLGLLIGILRLRLQPASATGPGWTRGGFYRSAQPVFAKGGALDKAYDRLGWMLACAATFVMLFITGHLGGNLTHGETYLVQYAPKPIRRLAGLSAETDPRPVPKDLASADIYLDVVAPALHSRCDACHNDGKKSGGFSLADYDKLMKGGKQGAVIVPGQPDKSNLFHRISLGPSDKDFMPKDGKTPLTPEQTAAVKVWIASGAPKSGLVGTLKLADAQKAILQKALPGAGGGAEDDSGGPLLANSDPLPTVPAADGTVVAAMEGNGFIVRRLASNSNLVEVNYTAPREVNATDLANLSKIGDQIASLNLRRSGLSDAEVKTIAGFKNLRVLRLQDTKITDQALAQFGALKDLRQLTLVGTKVTDAGMAQVAALPKLKSLYIWNSGVTPAGVTKLKADHKDLIVVAGLTRADVPAPEALRQPQN